MADKTPTPTSLRAPLRGSCHCGFIRYILFLTLPHPHPGGVRGPEGSQIFRRCNCTTCHKMGSFHVRPVSNHNDFLLLSPLDPANELTNYTHGDKEINFLFCPTCGVRVFAFSDEAATQDVDLAALGVPGYEAGKLTKIWRLMGEPDYGNRLIVNGHSIDAGQGFDMRDLVEKKQVLYIDFLDHENPLPARYERPHDNGCY